MSKHDVIHENLLAVTGARSFEKAVTGWAVKRSFQLPPSQMQTCELSGTPFRRGALVTHNKSRATIVVGGTCLTTLLRHRFPRSFRFNATRERIAWKLRQWYGSLVVDPGTWINWIIEHAPPRLRELAEVFKALEGVVPSTSDVNDLVRFHDRKRKFPKKALLADAHYLEKLLRRSIPGYITISEARKILAAARRRQPRFMIQMRAEAYERHRVLPYIMKNEEMAAVWRGLSPLEKRGVCALAALDERAAKEETPVCGQEAAVLWPVEPARAKFVWNPDVGLGFVARDDVIKGLLSRVSLWRSDLCEKPGDRERPRVYDLQCWRGVSDCSVEAVEQIEELAFKDHAADGEADIGALKEGKDTATA